MKFSISLFFLCGFVGVMWLTACFGRLEDQDSTVDLFSQSLKSADKDSKMDSQASASSDPANNNHFRKDSEQQQLEQQKKKTDADQQVDVKRSGLEDSLLFAAQQYFQFSDNGNKKSDEASASTMGGLRRDPLTTIVSTLFVSVTIILWFMFGPSSPRRRSSKRRAAAATTFASYDEDDAEEGDEDDDEEGGDDDDESPAEMQLCKGSKPIDDLECVLVTPEDQAVTPCRELHMRKPSFIAKGGLVRSIAVLAFDGRGRLLVRSRNPHSLNAASSSSSVSLNKSKAVWGCSAHGYVRFCNEELESNLNAAYRVACSDLGVECVGNDSTGLHHVGRVHYFSEAGDRHEFVHVFVMNLPDECARSLEGELGVGVFVDSPTAAVQELDGLDDLFSAILRRCPVFESWAQKRNSNKKTDNDDEDDNNNSNKEITRIMPNNRDAPPAITTGCATRSGGPRNHFFPALTKMYQFSCMVSVKMSMKKRVYDNPDEDICFDILRKVSRSFAMVIENLCDELRTPVCVYYLILRALDTVEDDIHIKREEKEKHLAVFYKYLASDDAVPEEIMNYGDGGYLELMQKFKSVVRIHKSLKPAYQRTIELTTKRMGEGMLLFLDSQNKVEKHDEYNEYCFYVAGLVGLGLTDMFADSGLEPDLAPAPMCGYHVEAPVKTTVHSAYRGDNGARASACAMSLVLQKTNIIRDYKEDIDDKRLWWPAEVWRCYAERAEDFQTVEGTHPGLACLNQLIVDALHHIPGCLDYLRRIRDPTVFSFCAVPQAMAIATLTTCFNNPNVFHRNVKISKGEACAAMVACKNIEAFCKWSKEYIAELKHKTDVDPIVFANARTALASAAAYLDRMM